MHIQRKPIKTGGVPAIWNPAVPYPSESDLRLIDQGVVTFVAAYDPKNQGDTAANVANITGTTNPYYPAETCVLPGIGMDNRYCIGGMGVGRTNPGNPAQKRIHIACAQNRSIHEENNKDERVIEAVSDDGGTTWTVGPLAPNPGDGVHCYSHGAFLSDTVSGFLYYLCPYYEGTAVVPNHFKNCQTAVFKLVNEWTSPAWTLVGLRGTGFPLENFKRTPNGLNWYGVASDANAQPAVIVSDGDNIEGYWNQYLIPHQFPSPAYNEANTFIPVTAPSEIRAIVRPAREASAFASVSRDGGRTWEKCVVDAMQMQNKKPGMLRLSNGVLMCVTTYGGLDTMVIGFSRPYADELEYAWELYGSSPPAVNWKYDPGPKYNAAGYTNTGLELGYSASRSGGSYDHKKADAYPGPFEHDGRVWIPHHRNHESIQVPNFPISKLLVPDVETDPVAWWKYDETSGTSRTDSSGNGYTATTHGSPSRVTGPRSGLYGLSFASASTQYVAHPIPTELSTFRDFTISLWFKVTSLAPNSDKTIWAAYVSGGFAIRLTLRYLGSNRLTWHISPRGGITTAYIVETFTPTLNIWYLATVDSAGRVRVNGVDATITTETNSPPDHVYMPHSQGFLAGASGTEASPTASTYFNGNIADVRLYNRLRTDAEDLALYNAPEWDPVSGITSGNTAQLIAMKARAIAGTVGPGRIFGVGDSTTAGQSAGDSGTGLYYNQNYNAHMAVAARAFVAAGIPARHDSIVGGYTNSFSAQQMSDVYGGRLTLGSGWSIGTLAATGSGLGSAIGSVGGYYFKATASGGALAMVSLDAWDTCELRFGRTNGAFSFTYDVDGGAPVTVSRSNGGTYYNETVLITAPSVGVHTVNIRWVSGTVGINSVIFIDSTAPKIQFINCGWPGSDIEDQNTTKYFSVYNQLTNYTNGEPSAFIMNLGINSLIDGDTLSTIYALNRTMIAKMKTLGDAIIMGFAPIDNYPTQADLIADDHALAVETSIPMIDYQITFANFAEANGLGQMYDQFHPNKAGQARMGSKLATMLLAI